MVGTLLKGAHVYDKIEEGSRPRHGGLPSQVTGRLAGARRLG